MIMSQSNWNYKTTVMAVFDNKEAAEEYVQKSNESQQHALGKHQNELTIAPWALHSTVEELENYLQ